MITNGGTGTTLQINDDGTDSDSTPFIIDNAGNVGIGTGTNGTYKLRVSSAADTNLQIQSGASNAARLVLGDGTDRWFVQNSTTDDFNIYDAVNNQYRITLDSTISTMQSFRISSRHIHLCAKH
jgi:hypothetical protein